MKVTVITVCKNAQDSIENTIKTVLSQTYKDIEYAIIDGKSTDGTLEILYKYQDHIDYFSSEEDSGIYNAMNKGIMASNGDVIYFLNADDAFANELVVEKIVECFLLSKEIDLLYGDVFLLEHGNQSENKIKKHECVDKMYFVDNTICHQAIFTRKQVFEKCGIFDETYKFAGDYEWLLRVLLSCKVSSKYLNFPVALYSMDGISSQGSASILDDERYRAQINKYSEWEKFLHRDNMFNLLVKNPMIRSVIWKCLGWELP